MAFGRRWGARNPTPPAALAPGAPVRPRGPYRLAAPAPRRDWGLRWTYTLGAEIFRPGPFRFNLATCSPNTHAARTVLVKRPIDPVHPDLLAMVMDEELWVLVLLDDPRLERVIDLGVVRGEPWIVAEHVPGERLDVRAGRAPPSVADALALAAAAADGLSAAHAARGPDGQAVGLVHRNVGLATLDLSDAGDLRIVDFGARRLRAGHLDAPSIGYRTLAPEQIRGETVEPRSDVYALGACLWELLAGRSRHEGVGSGLEWVQRTLTPLPAPSALRAELPRTIDELVLTATAGSPAGRFPTASAFAAAIRAELARLPLAAVPDLVAYARATNSR